jgi:hypothetical protein
MGKINNAEKRRLCGNSWTRPSWSRSVLRRTQEGYYGFVDSDRCKVSDLDGSGSQTNAQSISGTDCASRDSASYEIGNSGGVTSQLIEECLEELAINEKEIIRLENKNKRLKEKVSRLQEILKDD